MKVILTGYVHDTKRAEFIYTANYVSCPVKAMLDALAFAALHPSDFAGTVTARIGE